MRFLVIANPKHPVPLELAVGLSDAMVGWLTGLQERGKIETKFGYTGVPGGGCILNVDSAEEANSIIMQFPFGPFSEVQVHAVVDPIESVKQYKQLAQAMMPPGGGR
ncbi:MAG: hypothetical protein HY675_29180 [Chloroflexi bacterium]|nr:hypothetical protein [Chloroflexota bacterium]